MTNKLLMSASVALAGALFLLIYRLARKSKRPKAILRSIVGTALSLNGLIALASLAFVELSLAAPVPVLAQETGTTASQDGTALGAALATGLACIGAGIAVGIAGSAAIGGITEKPETLGRSLIFVGLAEGIAIYGLIISFMILNR